MTKQEQIEEILIDFGSKFYQKKPNGKIQFKNYDVKSAAEQIVNIFSLNPRVMRSSPVFPCECELKLDRCTMMCEYMIKKVEGK